MLQLKGLATTSATEKLGACRSGSNLGISCVAFSAWERRRWFPLVFLTILCACTFEPPPPWPPGLLIDPLDPERRGAFSDIVESGEQTVLEELGKIAIYHGFACAESNQRDRQRPAQVEQVHKIPKMLDEATVFLNGWQFRYLNGDHKVYGLGTAIFNIRGQYSDRPNDELRWEAAGAITDGNFDDPYRWCYRYTIIAWNRMFFAAGADHRDEYAFRGDNTTLWGTALSFHPAFIEVKQYAPNAMILPRGFGFIWDGISDHNLLQLAYNLDYNQRYIADGKEYVIGSPNLGADQSARAFHSWETKTIFKDNTQQRDYDSGEIVSVVSGPRMGAVQPPFTIVPREDLSNCVSSGDPQSTTRAIEDVPFDIAIPALTGWDLSYVCDDQEIEEIGVWIDGFSYDSNNSQIITASGPRAGGKLEYTLRSLMHDGNKGEDNRFRHRVSILGFDRTP